MLVLEVPVARWTHAFIIDVCETFRRAGTFHILVVIASLVRRALCTFLNQAWFSNIRCRVALSASSWGTIRAWSVIESTLTHTFISDWISNKSSYTFTSCVISNCDLVPEALPAACRLSRCVGNILVWSAFCAVTKLTIWICWSNVSVSIWASASVVTIGN